MPSASKTKGNANENAVAKLLSDWWGETFKRTPNSGALRWNGASWTYGDLLPPESFPAVVECKFYASVDVDAIIRTKPTESNILGWWLEAHADALRCYEETKTPAQPILIYKANRVPRRIILEADFFVAMGGRQLKIPALWISHPEMPGPLVMLSLDEFLTHVSRDSFLQASKMVVPSSLVVAV